MSSTNPELDATTELVALFKRWDAFEDVNLSLVPEDSLHSLVRLLGRVGPLSDGVLMRGDAVVSGSGCLLNPATDPVAVLALLHAFHTQVNSTSRSSNVDSATAFDRSEESSSNVDTATAFDRSEEKLTQSTESKDSVVDRQATETLFVNVLYTLLQQAANDDRSMKALCSPTLHILLRSFGVILRSWASEENSKTLSFLCAYANLLRRLVRYIDAEYGNRITVVHAQAALAVQCALDMLNRMGAPADTDVTSTQTKCVKELVAWSIETLALTDRQHCSIRYSDTHMSDIVECWYAIGCVASSSACSVSSVAKLLLAHHVFDTCAHLPTGNVPSCAFTQDDASPLGHYVRRMRTRPQFREALQVRAMLRRDECGFMLALHEASWSLGVKKRSLCLSTSTNPSADITRLMSSVSELSDNSGSDGSKQQWDEVSGVRLLRRLRIFCSERASVLSVAGGGVLCSGAEMSKANVQMHTCKCALERTSGPKNNDDSAGNAQSTPPCLVSVHKWMFQQLLTHTGHSPHTLQPCLRFLRVLFRSSQHPLQLSVARYMPCFAVGLSAPIRSWNSVLTSVATGNSQAFTEYFFPYSEQRDRCLRAQYTHTQPFAPSQVSPMVQWDEGENKTLQDSDEPPLRLELQRSLSLERLVMRAGASQSQTSSTRQEQQPQPRQQQPQQPQQPQQQQLSTSRKRGREAFDVFFVACAALRRVSSVIAYMEAASTKPMSESDNDELPVTAGDRKVNALVKNLHRWDNQAIGQSDQGSTLWNTSTVHDLVRQMATERNKHSRSRSASLVAQDRFVYTSAGYLHFLNADWDPSVVHIRLVVSLLGAVSVNELFPYRDVMEPDLRRAMSDDVRILQSTRRRLWQRCVDDSEDLSCDAILEGLCTGCDARKDTAELLIYRLTLSVASLAMAGICQSEHIAMLHVLFSSHNSPVRLDSPGAHQWISPLQALSLLQKLPWVSKTGHLMATLRIVTARMEELIVLCLARAFVSVKVQMLVERSNGVWTEERLLCVVQRLSSHFDVCVRDGFVCFNCSSELAKGTQDEEKRVAMVCDSSDSQCVLPWVVDIEDEWPLMRHFIQSTTQGVLRFRRKVAASGPP